MKIEALTYVVEVANCQSITAAAKKLYMSQTTLSAIIRSVEEELGVQIFRRISKGVTLTEAGSKIIPMLQDIVMRYEKVANLYQDNHSIGKNVHILLYPAACYDFSIDLSSQLKAIYPDVTPIFHRSSQNKIISDLLNGVANVGISAHAYNSYPQILETCRSSGLQCEPVCEDSFSLCVNPSSKFAGRKLVSLHELKDEHRATAHYFPDSPNSGIAEGFRMVRKTTVFTSNEAIKMAAVRGDVIAMLSGLSLVNDPYIESGRLIAIPLTGFPIDNRLITLAIYRDLKELTLVEKFLIEQARVYFKHVGQPIDQDILAL